MGLTNPSEATLPETISKLVSQIAGRPIEDVSPHVDLELARFEKRLKKADAAFKPLWEVLTRREKERAARRLQAARILTASLTSVVHG
jgi:Flp pilus assembly CpaF family ATPase